MVRPVMLYGFQTMALRKRERAEMKTLRFSLGVTKIDRNESIRGQTEIVLSYTQENDDVGTARQEAERKLKEKMK